MALEQQSYVQISLHQHCKSCILVNCKVLPDDVNSCEIISCRFGCPQKFHRCKESQHKKYCRCVKVPCVNQQFGCSLELPRGKLAEHLPVCSASVISINKTDIKRSEYYWYTKNYLEDHSGEKPSELEELCPFADAGCTFTYKQLYPGEKNSVKKVVYSDWLDSIGVTNAEFENEEACQGPKSTEFSQSLQGRVSGETVHYSPDNLQHKMEDLCVSGDGELGMKNLKSFSRQTSVGLHRSLSVEQQKQYTGLLLLPYEILQQIAEYLDGFSLCNLSVTCKYLRNICNSLLHSKGIVVPVWQEVSPRQDSTDTQDVTSGNSTKDTDGKWAVKYLSWKFSKSFEPVRQWTFKGNQALLLHLESCPFKKDPSYINIQTEPFSYGIIPTDSSQE